jgi:RHH-type transcriptional regulator, rel operon repressor / antitoxin RelB
MTSDVLTFRVEKSLSDRLTALAKATNRSKTFYAREALEQHIEDLEDYYLAMDVKQRLDDGAESLEDWGSLVAEIESRARVSA